MFEVVIQLGAILAVVVLFWNRHLAVWKADREKETPLDKRDHALCEDGYSCFCGLRFWYPVYRQPSSVCCSMTCLKHCFTIIITVAIMLILFGVLVIIIVEYCT